jgi:phosphoglucosamine mutase
MLDLVTSSPEPASQSRAMPDLMTPVAVGDIDAYVAHLVGALDGRSLDGLHVVLDCANGAAFELGPRALVTAGARVDVINAEPDGHNINAVCGSRIRKGCRGRAHSGADLGLARR